MTPTQEKFLQGLAEKLGWHEIHRPPCNGMWFVDGEIWPLSRLITPDGMMYLIERARERGCEVDTYRPTKGRVSVWCRDGVSPYGASDDTEPWAVALAVGKLFDVKMEDE